MNNLTKLFLASATVLASSCGTPVNLGGGLGGSSTSPSTADLSVTKITPSQGDIQVDPMQAVVITFNTALDATTVNSTNIVISSSGTPVAGTYVYSSSANTVTFTPTSGYPQGAAISVSVGTGLKRADGAALSTASAASFSTLSYASLIALWRFNGDATDASGNNHTLTANNITYDSSVKTEGSASAVFNGTNSYFDAGALNLGNAFTIAVWVYLPSPVQYNSNGIICNGIAGATSDGFKLFINTYLTSDLSVSTEAGNGSAGGTLKTTTNFMSVGAWRHFVFVIDKNAPAATRALMYFNGTQATQTYAGFGGSTEFSNDFNSATGDVQIGRFPSNNFYYSGRMDDFRIYNGVLTPSQIAQIATQHY